MRKKFSWRMIALFAAGLSGCATVGGRPMAYAPEAPSAPEEAGRRIAYSASLTVGVGDLPGTFAAAQDVVRKAGGRVERQSLGDLRAHLSARVPPDRFEDTLGGLEALGEVRHRRVGEEDLTDRIVDLEARRRNLESLRDRLRALLDRAEKIEEILSIERELTRVQSELDSMAARLAALGERTAWSEVDLTLERTAVPGPVGFVLQWAWRGVEKLFVWRPGA